MFSIKCGIECGIKYLPHLLSLYLASISRYYVDVSLAYVLIGMST